MPTPQQASLKTAVHRLLKEQKPNQARKLLEKALAGLAKSAPRAKEAALLDLLLTVELDAGRNRAALAVLSRRRQLGFRHPDRFFHSLLAARLLMETGDWFEARTELTGLLTKFTDPPGSLELLALYLECDEQCRNIMRGAMGRSLKAGIKYFALPIRISNRNEGLEKTIRGAHSLVLAANKKYSRFLIEVLDARNKQSRDAVIEGLRKFAQTEPVGYYRTLARSLLRELTAKRKRPPVTS